MREMQIEIRARLDGSLARPPAQPRSNSNLQIIDCAACFVAPKTSYFLTSDLEAIGREGNESVRDTSLGWLLTRRGDQKTSNVFHDSRDVVFPFSSNMSQRRVALLSGEPENHIIKVEGPPGTGKSLTIANVACHLVAKGKRVLISSQRDKALSVVDVTLRRLELSHLPMTLLRQDADSRRELRDRLDSIQKIRSVEDTRRECGRELSTYGALVADHEATEDRLHTALLAEHRIVLADRAVNDASTMLHRIAAGWKRHRALQHAKRHAPRYSDDLGTEATRLRSELLETATRLFKIAAEHRTGEASRGERNQLREFSKLLARNQSNAKNFSI
jgi:hypothetical protein